MQPVWTGVLRFGQIAIPVQLYKASESQEMAFRLLRRQDLSPIRHVRVAVDTDEEVPYEEVVRGYEVEKGRYVVMEEQDFQYASPLKTQVIDILHFTDPAQIPIQYFKRPYYLEPLEEGKTAYVLLRQVLEQTEKAGVACFVLRTQEHLALLQAQDDMLVLNLMRFPSELRSPEGLDLPTEATLSASELDLAQQLVEQMSTGWDPAQYQNTYVQDLKRIIEKKLAGQDPRSEGGEIAIPVGVDNLFARLQESLNAGAENRGV